MCMRVPLAPEEADKLNIVMFEPNARLPLSVPRDQTMGPAPFWPENFTAMTTA